MSLSQRPRRLCGSEILHNMLLNLDPSYFAERSRIENNIAAYLLRAGPEPSITNIPVVVHVVWNTPEQNISDDQIYSQIEVLNEDFRMTNSNITQVPDVWKDLAADARIEFFLAQEDPDGNPTNGITRTETSKTEFDAVSEKDDIKSEATGGADPWPSDRYLNIWIAPRIITPFGNRLLGYAQLPGGDPATDGIVIWNEAFGTNGTAKAPFDEGRTATHEIGHWLNLLHIWGLSPTCRSSDRVDDTPNAEGPNEGFPEFPHISCDNGPNGDMFMNYMDYTDDACMCMFTTGQVARMQATLDGPRSSFKA